MEESDKQQLEGLLQARSEDMRHGRRPGRHRSVPTPAFEPSTTTPAPRAGVAGRSCEDCGAEIGARRLRAMPRTTLCLECQRSSERAGTIS